MFRAVFLESKKGIGNCSVQYVQCQRRVYPIVQWHIFRVKEGYSQLFSAIFFRSKKGIANCSVQYILGQKRVQPIVHCSIFRVKEGYSQLFSAISLVSKKGKVLSGDPSRKQAPMQLVRECSSAAISACCGLICGLRR